MNKLLDPELTRDGGKEVKEKHIIEKTEDDNMFSWNGVSLFNIEENAPKPQHALTFTKNENLAIRNHDRISKVQDLQKEIKVQDDVGDKDDISKDITGKREAKPLIEFSK